MVITKQSLITQRRRLGRDREMYPTAFFISLSRAVSFMRSIIASHFAGFIEFVPGIVISEKTMYEKEFTHPTILCPALDIVRRERIKATSAKFSAKSRELPTGPEIPSGSLF